MSLKISDRFILYLTVLCLLSSCAQPGAMKKKSEYGVKPLLSIIDIYRDNLNHLSAVRRSGCPLYPSCSAYSIECFKKHGLLMGWVMTCDRLMRCGRDETRLSPQVLIDGKWRYYDPVEENDFWWYRE